MKNNLTKFAASSRVLLQRLVRLLFAHEVKARIGFVVWSVALLILGAHVDSNLVKWICFVLTVPPMAIEQLDTDCWRLIFRMPNRE